MFRFREEALSKVQRLQQGEIGSCYTRDYHIWEANPITYHGRNMQKRRLYPSMARAASSDIGCFLTPTSANQWHYKATAPLPCMISISNIARID